MSDDDLSNRTTFGANMYENDTENINILDI